MTLSIMMDPPEARPSITPTPTPTPSTRPTPYLIITNISKRRNIQSLLQIAISFGCPKIFVVGQKAFNFDPDGADIPAVIKDVIRSGRVEIVRFDTLEGCVGHIKSLPCVGVVGGKTPQDDGSELHSAREGENKKSDIAAPAKAAATPPTAASAGTPETVTTTVAAAAVGTSETVTTATATTSTPGTSETVTTTNEANTIMTPQQQPKSKPGISNKQKQTIQILGVEIDNNSKNLESEPFATSVAFMMGNEGSGMTSKQMSFCDGFVRISQYGGGTASLNVSVAASIVLHRFFHWGVRGDLVRRYCCDDDVGGGDGAQRC